MTKEEMELFKSIVAGFAANPAYANYSDMDEIIVRKAIKVTKLSLELLGEKKKKKSD